MPFQFALDAAEIEKRFTYHAPIGDQQTRYENLRGEARYFASLICTTSPASREQSLAITHLEEAIFWANAAIARNETEVTAGRPPNPTTTIGEADASLLEAIDPAGSADPSDRNLSANVADDHGNRDAEDSTNG